MASVIRGTAKAKLDTTALYRRVATKTINAIMSPLDHIAAKEKARPT